MAARPQGAQPWGAGGGAAPHAWERPRRGGDRVDGGAVLGAWES